MAAWQLLLRARTFRVRGVATATRALLRKPSFLRLLLPVCHPNLTGRNGWLSSTWLGTAKLSSGLSRDYCGQEN
jgi:hypothetical protein